MEELSFGATGANGQNLKDSQGQTNSDYPLLLAAGL